MVHVEQLSNCRGALMWLIAQVTGVTCMHRIWPIYMFPFLATTRSYTWISEVALKWLAPMLQFQSSLDSAMPLIVTKVTGATAIRRLTWVSEAVRTLMAFTASVNCSHGWSAVWMDLLGFNLGRAQGFALPLADLLLRVVMDIYRGATFVFIELQP